MNRKLALLILVSVFIIKPALADCSVFSQNNKFGLKDENNNIIVNAKYKKIIKLGDIAWIIQDGSKFGIIHNSGKILVEPKYSRAERILGKYVKFNKGDKYCVYDEMGFEILPAEYSSIDLLYGGFFVTCKNFKYGIADFNGQILLDNIFDDIYMPDFNTLVLVYNGTKVEIKRNKQINEPIDISSIKKELINIDSGNEFNPVSATGYYSITLTDYILKLFSSISPAYEQTIDELMFSNGADTVSTIVKFSWLPKFPFVYAKKYAKTVIEPNNGPLSKLKQNIKKSK